MSYDLEESVAAHALDALPPDEVPFVEAAISVDVRLQEDYQGYRRVAATLAEGFPEMTPAMAPDLWNRIARSAGLESAVEPADIEPVEPFEQAPTERATRWYERGWLLAGAAAAAVVVVFSAAFLAQQSTDPSLAALAASAAEQPNAVSVALQAPASGQDVMQAVVTADGNGYLLSESLPTLTSDRTYQLWVIVDDRIVSAGVLGSDPTVSAFRVEGNLAGLAVTEEVAGGVAVSENDPVALWLAEA